MQNKFKQICHYLFIFEFQFALEVIQAMYRAKKSVDEVRTESGV